MQLLEPKFGVPIVVAMILITTAAVHALARPPVTIEARVLGAVVTPEPPAPPPAVEAAPVVEAPAAATPVHIPVDRAPREPRLVVSVPRPAPFSGHVELPTLGERGSIVRVGLDKDGNMITPRGARAIAWLDNGSFPGPTRNAILAGHRNWSGAQGTFARLEDLRAGDPIRVVVNGEVFTFVTRWVRTYDPKNAPVRELLGPTEVDSVTLITCGGQFNRSTRHYEMRIVARGELLPAG